MTIDTNIVYSDKDVNKNLYRKKTYYTLVVEQEVLAKDKDEADKLFGECGIDHSQINHEITETKDGVETYMVDANYTESGNTEYIGKVLYTDDEHAEEDGDVELDQYADEVMPDAVDTMIQLEADLARGK
jgi:hypothetical protein